MKLLSTEQLRARVPVSKVKLNQMIARGEFPAPVQVAGQLMFVEAEVAEWVERQPRGLFPQPAGLKRKQAERRGQAK
jgi:predicted DNA-binding transcriptional regulator AlpA